MIKIIYSDLAIESLKEIVEFLNVHWTDKELETLRSDIKFFEQTINIGLLKHQNFENHKEAKFVLIGNRQVKLIYRLKNPNIAEIAIFWPNKKDPQLLKSLLKL